MHYSDSVLPALRKEACHQSHWPLVGTKLSAKGCVSAGFLALKFFNIVFFREQTNMQLWALQINVGKKGGLRFEPDSSLSVLLVSVV